MSAFRHWLAEKIAGQKMRQFDPAAGECTHSWSNWSDPQSIEVSVYTPTWGFTKEVEREGLFQDRRCLKCNIYERRLA